MIRISRAIGLTGGKRAWWRGIGVAARSPSVFSGLLGVSRSSFAAYATQGPPTKPGDDEDDAGAAATTKPTSSSPSPALFSKEAIAVPDDYNRWMMVPPALMTQLSIGFIYSWSIMNDPLTRAIGVVGPCSTDWGLQTVLPVFSLALGGLGVNAAITGKWIERSGPRKAGAVAATLMGAGLATSGLGAEMHNLPLLYGGYGLMGGAATGIAFLFPVSTLLKWFPDRKGLASGLAVMGFGGGAFIASPLQEVLLAHYREAPTYLGKVADVNVVTDSGRRVVETGGELKEIVVATATDLATSFPGLAEGVYVAGSGSTGAGMTLITCGAIYSAVMMASAFMFRLPYREVYPAAASPPGAISDSGGDHDNGSDDDSSAKPAKPAKPVSPVTTTTTTTMQPFVTVEQAMKVPQFYMIWGVSTLNAVAGVTLISCAKTMMIDVYGTAMPDVVDGTFAASYVAMLSVGNMAGRLTWASAADVIGPKAVFSIFGITAPICLALPYLTTWVAESPGPLPLYSFLASVFVATTFYGGNFATMPSYATQVFGSRDASPIYGRALLSVTGAVIVGPNLTAYLRNASMEEAIKDLATKCDPAAFVDTFGTTVDQVDALIEAKSVSINALLAIAPEGTPNPTVHLYDSSMYALAGIIASGFVLNQMIGKADESHFTTEEEELAKK